MAELTFFYGTMNCGKSTLALQTHHNQAQGGRRGMLFSLHDRGGRVISSRIGLSQPAVVVEDDLDLHAFVVGRLHRGDRLDYLICDEACFYTVEQIDQLTTIVDDLGIDVYAYGLRTSFTGHLFDATARLFEVADHCERMQVSALCWCGRPGTQNARVVDGEVVREGETVVVGDVADGDPAPNLLDEAATTYEVLCRRHFRRGLTRAMGLPLNASSSPQSEAAAVSS